MYEIMFMIVDGSANMGFCYANMNFKCYGILVHVSFNGYNDFIEFSKSVIKDVLSVSLFLHRKYKGCCAGYFWNVSTERCEGMVHVVTGRFPFNRQYQYSQHCQCCY